MTRIWMTFWPLLVAMAVLALFALPSPAGANDGEPSTAPVPREKPVLPDDTTLNDDKISTVPVPRDKPVLRVDTPPNDGIVVHPPEVYTPPPPVTSAQKTAIQSGYYEGYYDPANLTEAEEIDILIGYLDEKGMRSSTNWNTAWDSNLTVLRAVAVAGYAPSADQRSNSSRPVYYIYWTGEWTTIELDESKELVDEGEYTGGPKIAPVNHADFANHYRPPDPSNQDDIVNWRDPNGNLRLGNDPCFGQAKPRSMVDPAAHGDLILVCDMTAQEWKYARL